MLSNLFNTLFRRAALGIAEAIIGSALHQASLSVMRRAVRRPFGIPAAT